MKLFFFISLLLVGSLHCPSARAAVDSAELSREIGARLSRVEEFRFIEEEARNLGVRAYLFGGTAAAYAHYVKWDLDRERGDPKYQPDRFDYDYTNIFRSNQDLDIVIDGSPDQAWAFQSALEQRFPHLQGSKTAWEVRLLAQDMGDKQALLHNPEFLNQHTDSNSTGMIEVTRPRNGDPRVRDLRDWDSKNPFFLKDVRDSTLHYYFSPRHEFTAFFREGRNPPILSVIRYLTKAFQYELKMNPEDLARIKTVIDAFDPRRIQNEYVAKWIEKNGKKLIENAVNIEYAVNVLDGLGLRKKLAEIKDNGQTQESLAWWMEKEPLRSKPLGTHGKTARELFGDSLTFAHETRSFPAFESITRSHKGDPNVLVSRENHGRHGEEAAHGEGFYVKHGREGAVGNGLTIRFTLDPNAREGEDFTYVRDHDYCVIRNKNAIRVIPQSLAFTPLQYFKALAESDNSFHSSDRGILEKLRRRVLTKINAVSPEDEEKILELVKARIASAQPRAAVPPLLKEWFESDLSVRHPELLRQYFETNPELISAAELLLNPRLARQARLTPLMLSQIEREIAKYRPRGFVDKPSPFLMKWFALPISTEYPEYAREMMTKDDWETFGLVRNVLRNPIWAHRPELVNELLALKNPKTDDALATELLETPAWMARSEWEAWVDELVQRGRTQGVKLLGTEKGAQSPHFTDWFDSLLARVEPPTSLSRSSVLHRMIQYVLGSPHVDLNWAQRTIEKMVQHGDWEYDFAILRFLGGQSRFGEHPPWIDPLIERYIHSPDGYKRAELLNLLRSDILKRPSWSDRLDLLEAAMRDCAWNSSYIHSCRELVNEPQWKDHPVLKELCPGGVTPECLQSALASGKRFTGSSCAENFERLR